MSTTKKCNRCLEIKPTELFTSYPRSNGKRQLRSNCAKCDNIKRVERVKKSGQTPARQAAWKRYEAKRKLRRTSKLPSEVAHWICEDSKKSARKRNIEHDLQENTIAEFIADGCVYCGEKDLRITLDRIDNSKGYTMNNINPACLRCNYARGNMPFKAWKFLIDGMRKARLAGAFGNWQSKCMARI